MICVNDLWGPVEERESVGWWVGKGWREGDKDFGQCAQNSTSFKSSKYKNSGPSENFISFIPISALKICISPIFLI